jgi:hypothetical protein
MYLGAMHTTTPTNNKNDKTNGRPGTNRRKRMLPELGEEHRMDEIMFVVVGAEFVQRISERSYCHPATTMITRQQGDANNGLYDTNFGGTRLGLWLINYTDINILSMRSKFYFWGLFPNVPVQL